MNSMLFYSIIYVGSVFISSVAQILLKKSAVNNASSNIITFTQKHFKKQYEKLHNSKNGFICILKNNKSLISDYLNPKTVIAYVVFFGATLITVFAYKGVPLSLGPILGASEYIFVAVLSMIFLKEKIHQKKLIGLIIIIIGVVVYSLPCDIVLI